MGYAYYLLPDGREAGYGVEAECDFGGCHEMIDRGLGYLCGSDPDGHRDPEDAGCGRYYCGEHGMNHNCPNPDGQACCVQCDDEVDAAFHRESGGLCGDCLADYGFMATVADPQAQDAE